MQFSPTGLIEQIPDTVILANQAANATVKQTLGIRGRPNILLAIDDMSLQRRVHLAEVDGGRRCTQVLEQRPPQRAHRHADLENP